MRQLSYLLIAGLIIRVITSVVSLHADIRGLSLGAYIISQKGGFFSFYDYISQLPNDHLYKIVYRDDLFIYPPLPYLTLSVLMGILSPIYPWDAFYSLINDMSKFVFHPNSFYLLLLLKLPYLFFDFLCLIILRKYTPAQNRLLASILWIFNPITIYSTYMMGQFDILVGTAILSSLYFYNKNNYKSSLILMGIGGALKQFPLFLIPILAFSADKPWNAKIKLLCLGFATYLLILSPYLFSPGFRSHALLANLTDKIFYSKLPISGAYELPFFVVALFLAFWFSTLPKSSPTFLSIFVLLSFYSLVHYHPQWFTWISPLLVILFTRSKTLRFPLIILVFIFFATTLLFESSLHLGLFTPLFGPYNPIDINILISHFYPAKAIGNMLRGAFVSTSVFILYKIWKEKTV